jgi:dienelactone hydrolase
VSRSKASRSRRSGQPSEPTDSVESPGTVDAHPGADGGAAQGRAGSSRSAYGRSGALIAVGVSCVILVSVAASRARLGFGTVGDVAVGIAALLLLVAVYGLSAEVLARVAPRVLRWPGAPLIGVVLAGTVVLTALIGVGVVRPVAFLSLIFMGVVGAAVGELAGALRDRTRWRRASAAVAIAAAFPLLSALAMRGLESPVPDSRDARSNARVAYNPHERGPHEVRHFRYGSGPDNRRATYGDSVTLRTEPLNLERFSAGFEGWRSSVHQDYWGFGLDRAPLNGMVWLPEGRFRAPLVVLMHGVGTEERSEAGFGYLADLLASRGFAVVSVDANFLSGPWAARGDAAMSARSWLLLQHLRAIAAWNGAAGNPLSNRLDLSRVALGGHSRGGEAGAAAAMLSTLTRHPDYADLTVDSVARVRAVFALSPTDGLARLAGAEIVLSDASYLSVSGTNDADVIDESGSGQYDRVMLDNDVDALKVSVRLVGANHSQFNSEWGTVDHAPPLSWLVRRVGVLAAPVQQEAAAVAVVAFLEATLGARGEARESLLNPERSPLNALPVDHSVRALDGRTTLLADFEEDLDPVTASQPGVTILASGTTLWREERPLRRRSAVARVSWDATPGMRASPSFALTLPEHGMGGQTGAATHLVFAVASANGATDLTVEVEDAAGVRARIALSELGGLDEVEQVTLWTSAYLEAARPLPSQLRLRTIDVALKRLVSREPAFNPAQLRAVRFVFDRTASGSILLDDIGLRSER